MRNTRTRITTLAVLISGLAASASLADIHLEVAWSDGGPKRRAARYPVIGAHRVSRFLMGLHRNGEKGSPGGLYVHVEPGNCFLASGYWQMDPKLLRRWRERLVANPDGWMEIAEQAKADGLTLGPGPTSTLKRMPRGFSDYMDSPVAEALRWKGATLNLELDDTDVQSPALADRVVEFAKASLPFLSWGWDLVDSVPTKS